MGALLVGVNRAYPFAMKGSKKEQSIIPAEYIDTMYKIVHFSPLKISLQALSLLLQITNNDRLVADAALWSKGRKKSAGWPIV